MPFLGSFLNWYRYQNKVVPVPLMQRPNGTGIIQSGTGTTHQNQVGTGTTAPYSSDVLYFDIF